MLINTDLKLERLTSRLPVASMNHLISFPSHAIEEFVLFFVS